MRNLFIVHLALRWALLALAALALTSPPAHAQRVALVVGNAAYADKPLRNPVNDAELMQRTLRGLGFDVVLVRNADRRELLDGLRDFEAKALNADVALFYFAGHGTQVAGNNYLLPLKARIRTESDVPDEAVDAGSVLRRIEDARAKVGLVILDACRDNPYAGPSRSSSRGLGRMSVPTGSIVAYATAPGSVAEDGSGANGVYTEQLARHLATPGLDLREVFDRTATDVERITQGKQKPREDVGLRGRFVLKDAPGTQAASVAPVPTGQPTQADAEQEAWELAKRRDTIAAYQAYLNRYPQGRYAETAKVALQGLQPAASNSLPAPNQQPGQQNSQPSQTFKDCADCPEMVTIPAGSFTMGSDDFDNSKPIHRVNIAKFALGKYEITVKEWEAVMGKFTLWPQSSYTNSHSCIHGSCAMYWISWHDANKFIETLNHKTGKKYRLPSEAEWEYAARSGVSKKFWWGDRYEDCKNCDSFSDLHFKITGEVGKFNPNKFGLYDVAGNVSEWTQDVFHENYIGAPIDGSARDAGGKAEWTTKRVVRGGGREKNYAQKAGFRTSSPGNQASTGTGFRVARDIP